MKKTHIKYGKKTYIGEKKKTLGTKFEPEQTYNVEREQPSNGEQPSIVGHSSRTRCFRWGKGEGGKAKSLKRIVAAAAKDGRKSRGSAGVVGKKAWLFFYWFLASYILWYCSSRKFFCCNSSVCWFRRRNSGKRRGETVWRPAFFLLLILVRKKKVGCICVSYLRDVCFVLVHLKCSCNPNPLRMWVLSRVGL